MVFPSMSARLFERHLRFARNLHLETRIIEGREAADALVDFARRNQVSQILLARGRTIAGETAFH
jgi:K+-sensing histidine kinase KdpD